MNGGASSWWIDVAREACGRALSHRTTILVATPNLLVNEGLQKGEGSYG